MAYEGWVAATGALSLFSNTKGDSGVRAMYGACKMAYDGKDLVIVDAQTKVLTTIETTQNGLFIVKACDGKYPLSLTTTDLYRHSVSRSVVILDIPPSI